MRIGCLGNMGMKSLEEIKEIECSVFCRQEPVCPFITKAHALYCVWPPAEMKIMVNSQHDVCGIGCPKLRALAEVDAEAGNSAKNKPCSKILCSL